MKIGYILAVMVSLIIIVGCKPMPVEPAVQAAPTPAPAAPVVEATPEPATEVMPDVEGDIAAQKEELSYEGADETAQRLIQACKAGNAGLCATLKNRYGIDMSPASTEAKQEQISEDMAEDSDLGE